MRLQDMAIPKPITTVEDVLDSEHCGQPMALTMRRINGNGRPVMACLVDEAHGCGEYILISDALYLDTVDKLLEIARANRQSVERNPLEISSPLYCPECGAIGKIVQRDDYVVTFYCSVPTCTRPWHVPTRTVNAYEDRAQADEQSFGAQQKERDDE